MTVDVILLGRIVPLSSTNCNLSWDDKSHLLVRIEAYYTWTLMLS